MARVIDVVRKLAPRGNPAYLKAFETDGDAQLARFGINTPLRFAHFLARVMSETGALSVLVENPNYTKKNLEDQWDKGNGRKQFSSRAEMASYAGRPEDLFNRWYGNRMGNGPASTGDGFRYRGRGPLQTTGKSAYAKYGARMGVDLVGNPDALLKPENILLPSLYEWQDSKCNAHADRDDALAVARIINVGTLNTSQIPNGYEDQKAWLAKAKKAISDLGWTGDRVPIEAPPPEPKAPAKATVVAGAAVATAAAASLTWWDKIQAWFSSFF